MSGVTVERTVEGMRRRAAELRSAGGRVALVPTMGALHAGHMALVSAARQLAEVVVVSIFVNPLQFSAGEDLARYPRTLDADLAALDQYSVEAVFVPSVQEMYPAEGGTTIVPRAHAGLLEGAVRPGHFTGVLTVVAKLFNVVQPDVAVFGQKDLQQLSLVRSMVDDLNFPVLVHSVGTVRETDGLAMSSRNAFLSEPDRIRATRLYAALEAIRAMHARGETDPEALAASGAEIVTADPGLRLDYLAVVDPFSFTRPETAQAGNAVVGAVRVGSTRLIDNIIL